MLATGLPAFAGPDRLDLRLPPSTARSVLSTPNLSHPSRALRLESRKSLLELGMEASREALVACQKGAYLGATVAASNVQVAGGDAQPDHCYRF